jgi:hypothetical protein
MEMFNTGFGWSVRTEPKKTLRTKNTNTQKTWYLNVTIQFKNKHAVLLTLRSVKVMQCNASQCNAIHAMLIMQCNAMYTGSPSVRTEWSQSIIFLFFLSQNFYKKWQNFEARFRTQDLSLKWKSECNGRTYGMKSFYLSLKWKYQKMSVCTNVTDGQTSFSFSLFQFSRIQSVSLSVCTRSGAKKKTLQKTQTDRKTNKQTQ